MRAGGLGLGVGRARGRIRGGASVPVAPALAVLSAPGVNPASFRLTPAVGSLATDSMLFRYSQLSDFSDVDTAFDTLEPGGILSSYIDFDWEFPANETWYVNAGIQRGATIVWSDTVLTVVVGSLDHNALLRTDGSYLLRTDGSRILRAA